MATWIRSKFTLWPFYAILLAGLSFALSAGFVRDASDSLSPFFFLATQGAVCAVGFLLAVLFFCPSAPERRVWRLVIERSVYAAVGIVLLTFNFSLIPVPLAMSLANTSPLMFSLLAIASGRIAVDLTDVFSLLLIGGGAIVQFVFFPSQLSLVGVGIGIVGAVFSGLSFRKLSAAAKECHWSWIGLALSLTILAAGVVGTTLHSAALPTVIEWPSLVLSGLFLFLGQFLMTAAFGRLSGTVAVVLSFSSIAWAYLLHLLQSRPMGQEISVAGYGTMVLGAILFERSRSRKVQVSGNEQ